MMTEQAAMNILVRSGAKWVDEAIRDNPDGPITEHTTRTRTEIEYEVTIGYDGDRNHGRLIWHKTVAFGHDDAHCGGGSAFVEAARESGDVAFAALELLELRRPFARQAVTRRYFDTRRSPKQSPAVVRGPDGVYRSLTGLVVGIDVPCEHCDGERSHKVRLDALRGYVCPSCDSSLDEMLGEGSYAKKQRSS